MILLKVNIKCWLHFNVVYKSSEALLINIKLAGHPQRVMMQHMHYLINYINWSRFQIGALCSGQYKCISATNFFYWFSRQALKYLPLVHALTSKWSRPAEGRQTWQHPSQDALNPVPQDSSGTHQQPESAELEPHLYSLPCKQ